MDDIIVIDNKEYYGYKEGQPNLSRISSKSLEDYILIVSEDYDKIKLDWEILFKHPNKNEYIKGVVIKIIDEKIFILKNNSLRLIWPMDITEYDLYIKNHEKIYEENRKKENLWKLYQEGYVKILDSPEI